MRLPGAAFLIAIGLFVLWLATTGQLDRMGAAWDYAKDGKPLPNVNPNVKPGGDTATTASGILDPGGYHVAALMTTLDPITANQPGGTF